MGLFVFIKKQLLKVIEWKDDAKDTIVYRFPLTDRDEIMTSSTLVVRESQVAIFVHKGQIADVFTPGTYKLSTENIPFLTKLLALPTGFESPIKAEIYYVNTKQFVGQKWGTQNPIIMRDKEFGTIRLRGFGIYSFRVDDAKLFMREVFGTNALYTVGDVSDHIKPILIQVMTDIVAESNMSILDLAASYKEFSDAVVQKSVGEFSKLGLKICSVVIENLSLPEEVEKVLDERTKLGVLEEKMGTYTQYQAAQAIKDAANNPSGGLAGLGVGVGAGATLGHVFAENVVTQNVPPQPPRRPQKPVVLCKNCGAQLKEGAKFCSDCGKKQGPTLECPGCKTVIPATSKFCPECGRNLLEKPKCKNCGLELKETTKFCPECGTKVQ
ncbi:MAG: SPFH domain-containing protein [Clostridia bacterium]|nr:SPFH domain-containing protein [Clostridia bacterium]